MSPSWTAVAARHPVVIVGAGPIGMTAALVLARYGIRSVLLDRKDTFNDGSRALCIARPSMHILERIGAVAPFLDKALGWRFGRSYYRGEQIFRLEMPHPPGEKYLPMYNLQQQYIEQYLHDAVAACGLVDMRWQSEFTGIDCGNDGVSLSVASPAGDYRLEADYVLAADGARSPVRAQLGLRMKGENYEGKYVIADIRMDHDFPTERRAFFEPSGNPGGTVLIHKQPENIWRVDYQLREGESEEAALLEENIRARVGAILGDIGHDKPWELEWWSIYSANTLCLDDYRHGRVFFIGDAAHIVPIFGVRGLNNGLADADNLGWKLAAVLNGEADEKLLDSYSPERRGATLDVFANATKSTRFMTPPTRGWRLAREAALSLSLKPRVSARPRQSQADAALHLFGKPADALSGARCRVCRRTGQRQRFAQRQTRRRQFSAGSRRRRHDGDLVLRWFAQRRTGRPACATRPARPALCGTAGCAARVQRRQPERLPMRRRNCPPVRCAAGHASICCVPTCTSPDAGRPSLPTKSCEPPAFAWGERRHDRDAFRRLRSRL